VSANSIISNNHADYGIYNSGSLTAEYTNFFNNNPGQVGGNSPTGFGVLMHTNVNDDSCDVYSNIFLDPLFEDPGTGNFQITWANFPVWDETRSPCIDAGDPGSPSDPDTTVTDMGALFFDQT